MRVWEPGVFKPEPIIDLLCDFQVFLSIINNKIDSHYECEYYRNLCKYNAALSRIFRDRNLMNAVCIHLQTVIMMAKKIQLTSQTFSSLRLSRLKMEITVFLCFYCVFNTCLKICLYHISLQRPLYYSIQMWKFLRHIS